MPTRSIRTRGGQVARKDELKSFKPFNVVGATSRLSFSKKKGTVSKRRGRVRGRTRVQMEGRKGSFWMQTRSGHPMLVQRKKGQLRFLYIGLPRVLLRPALDFHENATATAARRWGFRMNQEALRALAKVGLSSEHVRFVQ